MEDILKRLDALERDLAEDTDNLDYEMYHETNGLQPRVKNLEEMIKNINDEIDYEIDLTRTLKDRISALEMRAVSSANTKAVLNEINELIGDNNYSKVGAPALAKPIRVWQNRVQSTLKNMRKSDPSAKYSNALKKTANQYQAVPKNRISTKGIISGFYNNTPHGYVLQSRLRSKRAQPMPTTIEDKKRFENMVRTVREERPRNKNFIKTAVNRLIAQNIAKRNQTKKTKVKVATRNPENNLEEFIHKGIHYHKTPRNYVYSMKNTNTGFTLNYVGKFSPETQTINTNYPEPK